MPSVEFNLPLPQLLFLLGLGLAFLGLIGAKGTIREIAFDLSPTTNRFAAVGFGVALVLVGTQYPRLFPPAAGAAALPAATPAVTLAAAPTSPPIPIETATPIPTVAAASTKLWECSLPGNFHVRERPGNTYHLNGDPLHTGDKVKVSGWSKPTDNSSDLFWFRIAAADGRTGWMASAATIGDTRLFLRCNFASEGPVYPFPQLSA
jgi:hypothetical protein